MEKEKSVITPEKLAFMIDHTCLKPYAVCGDIERLCREAKEYGFRMVAVNSCWSSFCREQLKGTKVHVGAAVSFPLGQTSIETKVYEAKDAIINGADEIDYVIHIGKLKEKDYAYVRREMQEITALCRDMGAISKVIFENCFLTKDEIRILAEIAGEVGPDFIKTSTGFGSGGALLADVRLMRECTGKDVKIKAAGGIRDLDTCLKMIEAGAGRIGTSSGIKILGELKENKNVRF